MSRLIPVYPPTDIPGVDPDLFWLVPLLAATGLSLEALRTSWRLRRLDGERPESVRWLPFLLAPLIVLPLVLVGLYVFVCVSLSITGE